MPSVQQAPRADAALAAELRLSVMRLRRRLAHERHPENPLSLGAMAVLGCLHRCGEMSIGELAASERVQPPSMTRAVNSLEADGYVTRGPHDTDGRQVVVALTDHGRETVLADRERRDAWLATRLGELSPDDRAVLRRAAPLLDLLSQKD